MLLLALFHFFIMDLIKEIGNYYSHFTNERAKEAIDLICPAITQLGNGQVRVLAQNRVLCARCHSSKGALRVCIQ